MGVRLVVAVTDGDWFDHLRARPHLTEVNFWSPSDRTFRALEPGELFLFKLHAPRNFIIGGGWFAHSTILPCSLAWEAFGEENATTLREMRARIARYTKRSVEEFAGVQWRPRGRTAIGPALDPPVRLAFASDNLRGRPLWMPAFAGMTTLDARSRSHPSVRRRRRTRSLERRAVAPRPP